MYNAYTLITFCPCTLTLVQRLTLITFFPCTLTLLQRIHTIHFLPMYADSCTTPTHWSVSVHVRWPKSHAKMDMTCLILLHRSCTITRLSPFDRWRETYKLLFITNPSLLLNYSTLLNLTSPQSSPVMPRADIRLLNWYFISTLFAYRLFQTECLVFWHVCNTDIRYVYNPLCLINKTYSFTSNSEMGSYMK
jgi:hypothetical protein